MRKKRNNRSDVLIDLTSLLDVIFIILLVVLCGQSGLKGTLDESLAAARDAQAQAKAVQEAYEDMQDTADNINNYVVAASVSVPYASSDIKKREIIILMEGEDQKSIPLNGLDTEDSFKEFKTLLEENIKQNKDRPVILSLNDDDDKILYRDELSINKIYDELSNEYDNVYIKNYLGKEQQ